MKRDNLKLGEERKKREKNGRLGGKRYFFVIHRSQCNMEKPFPHDSSLCSALSPVPSSFPTLFLLPADSMTFHITWNGVGPRIGGWAHICCGAGVHRGYKASATEGGERGSVMSKKKTNLVRETEQEQGAEPQDSEARLKTLSVRVNRSLHSTVLFNRRKSFK